MSGLLSNSRNNKSTKTYIPIAEIKRRVSGPEFMPLDYLCQYLRRSPNPGNKGNKKQLEALLTKEGISLPAKTDKPTITEFAKITESEFG